ncbi:hypothetical protein [Cyanobacterium sp. Dongsha4]|uniref:hypothetical protein n=1 Tax=Cyanobacterium sp. DS4 TaxID=2878255 RepID=UPI002E81F685|nr:hypothetical protein [Cyanobacterium sp. Dongsha4]WVK99935.1 hypothetical protein Dongsha4_14890 [Cyanobacterium sp. Dongsha4]
MIDPLWYFRGNQITGVNRVINERISKVNLFLNNYRTSDYDCLIFGSSKTTLLPASQISGHNCFNFAFSAGKITDFIDYARYIKFLNFNPKIVYVGVDEFNFTYPQENTTPEFIRSQKLPTPFYKTLFSIDTTIFSFQTLFNPIKPQPRYYDSTFEVKIRKPMRKFNPKIITNQQEKAQYDSSIVQLYQELKLIFPEAYFIGYAPPLSAWTVVNRLYNKNLLEKYLSSMIEISGFFDVLYDFSIPSSLTTSKTNTYDGQHYTPEANIKVIQVVENNLPSEIGILVQNNKPDLYRNKYRQRIKWFLDQFLIK